MKLYAKFYVDNKVVRKVEARDISHLYVSDNVNDDYPIVVVLNDEDSLCCEEVDFCEQ